MKTYEIHLEDGTYELAQGHTADLYDGMVTVYEITTTDRANPTRVITYQRSLVGVVEVLRQK